MSEEKKDQGQEQEARAQEAAEETKEQAAEEKSEAVVEAKAEETKTETAVEEEAKVELSEKAEGMIKMLEEMSVLELSDLVKALEEKFGVQAAAPVAAMTAPGAGAPGAAAGGQEEEKSVFDVVLAEVGAKKINVIKEIRALTSLGLKEAKDLVESAPASVKDGVPKDEADKMKKQLEEVGAKIELK